MYSKEEFWYYYVYMEGADLVGVIILTFVIAIGLGYYITRIVVGV